GIDGPGGDDIGRGDDPSLRPIDIDVEPRDASAGRVGPEGDRVCPGHHGDVRRLQGGPRDAHLGIALGIHHAWEPVAGLAPDARAPLTEVDTQRQWEWTQAVPFETVGDV